ncbi:PREDICTED: zinc finger HIT domain-containing protein 2 [Ipomoea nil]|uniref:zinc finger HIT domain-containing protein 2 n=1 Tax=Ipomoea nil TaxID=35883 RepID=UPI000900C983|nr:PREDICTED: zinc finger HIT domain-containing protein 2 [Ipomoea nil]XP_019169833.1 PREDICTED: zinc finger HIT domain-containing protein 2 [Ipomoea nil]
MPDTIVTSGETPSTSSQLNSSSRIICRVCQKQFSLYTCPRCNTRYCSLPCYKSHSLRCTESFMRENVMEELHQSQPDEQSKQKMLGILKRLHSEDEMESLDEDEPDFSWSESTIQKILSGNEISLDDLTPEEQKRYQKAIASGELSKLIKPWEPWWTKQSAKYISLGQDGTQLVQPISKEESDDIESEPLHDIPPGPESPLPSVSKLSVATPSPLLAVHLVDIVYSYCFTLRIYNGDWQSDPTGSATVLLSVSSVMGEGAKPETVLEALSHCLEQTCSPALRHMGGLQLGFRLIEDVIELLYLGGAALVCLLSDLQRLIQSAEKELKSAKQHKSERSEMKKRLRSAERKVYFIMCWVHEQTGDAWSSLAAIVKVEQSHTMEYAGTETSLPKKEIAERVGKPFIKEIQ